MIAHIWKTLYGWKLEIAEDTIPGNFKVIRESMHQTKADAKRAAYMAGAKPWNY